MKIPPQKEFLLSKKTTNAAQKDLGNSATVVIKAAKNTEDKVKASLHFFFFLFGMVPCILLKV